MSLTRIFIASVASTLLISEALTTASASSSVNVDGKVVIANLDKHEASIRINGRKKDIKSRKASVLSPKQFPLSLEIWNGKRGRGAWIPRSIPAAGVYTLRYLDGEWKFAKHKKPSKPTTPAKKPSDDAALQDADSAARQGAGTVAPSKSVSRQPMGRQPTYHRSTGSVPRVVRGSGRFYYGGRVPFLRRVCTDLLWLYRYVRDEDDRDLIREIIIGGEIDDAIEEELWDRLDDLAVNLPATERLDFERALDDLRSLDEQDLRDLEDTTDLEWGQVREGLGNLVDDNAWQEIESDFGEIETSDLADNELDSVGIDSLESDIDLGDLAGGDLGGDLGGTSVDTDISDIDALGINDASELNEAADVADSVGSGFGTSLDDVDIGELGGDIGDIDVAELGADFGGGTAEMDSLDGGNAGLGESGGLESGGGFGGNLGFGGGLSGNLGFGAGSGSPLGGLGGGMNYDQGGFDDFGGSLRGDVGGNIGGPSDFGGFQGPGFQGPEFGGFGGGDFGGGMEGEFGGGMGADFGGGGFDDFGGGGFDDFGGGGFDDFGGGGFDDF